MFTYIELLIVLKIYINEHYITHKLMYNCIDVQLYL